MTLKQFVSSHLGGWPLTGREKFPIDAERAEIIKHLTNNEHTCYIQYPEEYEADQNIYLWDYKAWIASEELRVRQKRYQHQSRVEGYLFTANVEDVTAAIVKKYKLDEDRARSMAWKWIKTGNKEAMKIVAGVEKIKTKEEEL